MEKQLYGHYKRQTSVISHEKTWTWLRKRNLKREIESLLIAAQNNVIKTTYVKASIDKAQEIADVDNVVIDMINYIISKYSELAQREYRTRHDWLGNVLHWKLYKMLKIGHTKKMVYSQTRIRRGCAYIQRKWNGYIIIEHF